MILACGLFETCKNILLKICFVCNCANKPCIHVVYVYHNLKITNFWPVIEMRENVKYLYLWSDFRFQCQITRSSYINYASQVRYNLCCPASEQTGSSPANPERKVFKENHGLLYF